MIVLSLIISFLICSAEVVSSEGYEGNPDAKIEGGDFSGDLLSREAKPMPMPQLDEQHFLDRGLNGLSERTLRLNRNRMSADCPRVGKFDVAKQGDGYKLIIYEKKVNGLYFGKSIVTSISKSDGLNTDEQPEFKQVSVDKEGNTVTCSLKQNKDYTATPQGTQTVIDSNQNTLRTCDNGHSSLESEQLMITKIRSKGKEHFKVSYKKTSTNLEDGKKKMLMSCNYSSLRRVPR